MLKSSTAFGMGFGLACHPGRHHPGMVGDIISERWAELSRNGWAASFRNHGRLAPESAKCALGQEQTGNYRAIRGLQRI
jgi:hypothetical protein